MQLRPQRHDSRAHSVWVDLMARAACDLAMVQLAALASFAAILAVQLSPADPGRTWFLAQELRSYYVSSFLPLSLIFPLTFYFCGLYTRARTYEPKYKLALLARAATTASLVYLFANFMVTRASALPRSGVLAFFVLVNVLMVGSRLIKARLSHPLPSVPASNETSRFCVTVAENNAPVLVIGGGGYIGSILCRKLLDQGRTVRVLDSFVYGNTALRALFGRPRFEVAVGDCRNIQSVVAAVNGARSIIHLAAIVGDPACEQDRRGALEVNYSATRMITEIAKGYGVRRLVFASSCSVYGQTDELVDEKSAVRPISLYAQTKIDSERALIEARSDRFHPVILRLATVFGHSHRPRFDLVVNLLTAKALREGVITIFNGEQWRPFIHVRDVADGFVSALEAPLEGVSGRVFNLGDSRMNYTLLDVAETIRSQVPHTRIEHVVNPDRRNYRVSFDKVKHELNFQCKVDLAGGIAELIAALKNETIADYTSPVYHNQNFLKVAGRLASQQEVDSQVMAAFALALHNHEFGVAAMDRELLTS